MLMEIAQFRGWVRNLVILAEGLQDFLGESATDCRRSDQHRGLQCLHRQIHKTNREKIMSIGGDSQPRVYQIAQNSSRILTVFSNFSIEE